MSEVVAREIAEQATLVARTLDADAGLVARARALLADAPVVRFLAVGSSRHAAGYGAEVLEVVAGRPAAVLPAPGWGTAQPRWLPGDVVVAVSQSGRTPALVAAITEASAQGARVIAVANVPHSPLVGLADVALVSPAGPERVVAATKSVTGLALVLRGLAGDVAPHHAARLTAAITACIAFDVDPIVRQLVPQAVVCNGVAGEWIAQEVALKLAEMTGRAAFGKSLVEFLHGPCAARVPVLALLEAGDPNGLCLGEREGVVLIGPSDADVVLPSTGDVTLDPLVRLVAGQVLVLGWARALGEDPDADRGLAKVTATR